MKFDKEGIREHHSKVIGDIMSQYSREEAIKHITNYIMYRVGAIIKSERMNCDKRVEQIQHGGHKAEGGNNGDAGYNTRRR